MSKPGKWKAAVAAALITGALAGTSVPSGATTLYRWTDANGTPVISDRPPPQGTPYTASDSRSYGTKPSSTPTPMAAESAPQPANAGMLLGDGEAPEPREQPAPASAAECAQIKDDIFKLDTFARVRAVDPESGAVLYMTESERAARLADARAFLAERC